MKRTHAPTPRIDRLKASIREVLRHHNHRHAVRERTVAALTRRARYYRCMRIADDLYEAGHQLTDVQRLRLKHVRAILGRWSELEPRYRDDLRSALRFICRAIGKPQFLEEI